MVDVITKIAFYNPATDEYYSGTKNYNIVKFSDDISKAVLYTGNDPYFADTFKFVKYHSKCEILCIDVIVSFSAIKIDNNAVSSKLNLKLSKLHKEFEPLDEVAKVDIDQLSEKDYKKWKKLRGQIADLETS